MIASIDVVRDSTLVPILGRGFENGLIIITLTPTGSEAWRRTVGPLPVVGSDTALAQHSVSFTADGGVAYALGRGGRYTKRELQGIRLAGSIRLIGHGPNLFLEASDQSFVNFFNRGDRCVTDDAGGCPPDFPEFIGASLVGGIVLRPTEWLEVRAGAGAARLRTNDPAVSSVNAVVGLADVALFPLSHIGVALMIQRLGPARYHDDRLTLQPRTLALRLR